MTLGSLPGYDTMKSGRWVALFQCNILPPSTEQKIGCSRFFQNVGNHTPDFMAPIQSNKMQSDVILKIIHFLSVHNSHAPYMYTLLVCKSQNHEVDSLERS